MSVADTNYSITINPAGELDPNDASHGPVYVLPYNHSDHGRRGHQPDLGGQQHSEPDPRNYGASQRGR